MLYSFEVPFVVLLRSTSLISFSLENVVCMKLRIGVYWQVCQCLPAREEMIFWWLHTGFLVRPRSSLLRVVSFNLCICYLGPEPTKLAHSDCCPGEQNDCWRWTCAQKDSTPANLRTSSGSARERCSCILLLHRTWVARNWGALAATLQSWGGARTGMKWLLRSRRDPGEGTRRLVILLIQDSAHLMLMTT